jgi:hypothetical protein
MSDKSFLHWPFLSRVIANWPSGWRLGPRKTFRALTITTLIKPVVASSPRWGEMVGLNSPLRVRATPSGSMCARWR